jgi:hypothetical protein
MRLDAAILPGAGLWKIALSRGTGSRRTPIRPNSEGTYGMSVWIEAPTCIE